MRHRCFSLLGRLLYRPPSANIFNVFDGVFDAPPRKKDISRTLAIWYAYSNRSNRDRDNRNSGDGASDSVTKNRRIWLALAFAVVGLLSLLTGITAGVILTVFGEELPPLFMGALAGTAFGWSLGGMLLGFFLREHRLGRAALFVSALVFFCALPVMNTLLHWNIDAQMRRLIARE
jgi:hypothetical protein